ncbi:hypothetical protein N7523_005764 [Penicillium sp. IBT 18751x]|nr:hypothetical protein N7523_005644 [Penicillium sp. IBT 18751x]KAJ6118013.1 hypothetical protein N7523_005764 [Penicillium sp. IBT 18751x]
MSSTIDCLSLELVALIAENLESVDLLNFRLSSRHLRQGSLSCFIKRYFRERIHLLDQHSLSTLLQISSDSRLGPEIRKVVISPDHFVPNPVSDETFPPPYWMMWTSNSPGPVEKKGYEKYVDEQEYTRETGLDIAYLTQIVKNANNCQAIMLDDQNRPWGAATVNRNTGHFPTSSINWDYSRKFLKRAIHVIIAALTAGEAQTTSLELCTGLERPHVHPSMLVFPPFYLDHVPWVVTLTSLRLTMDPDYGENPDHWAKLLADFVMRFPNLDTLDLYFDTRVDKSGFHALSQILNIPHLQTLELAGIDCLPEDLFNLFHVHRNTLREIGLHIVGISTETGGSWHSVLALIRDRLNLTTLRMVDCDMDEEDICFGEGDRNISRHIQVVGGDPRPMSRLIEGLRTGAMNFAEHPYIID